MNKYILRIPAYQFAFIEAHIEGEHDDAVREYHRLTELVKGNGGLSDKEWRIALDAYLQGKGMSPEVHERMNERQKWMIHQFDNHVARQKYVNPKDNIHHSLQDNS